MLTAPNDAAFNEAAAEVYNKVTAEIKRLRCCGAVSDDTPPKVVLGVALENVHDALIPAYIRKRADYKNLRCF